MSEVIPQLEDAVRRSPFEVLEAELYSFRANNVDIRQAFAITRDKTETTVLASSDAIPSDTDPDEPVGPYKAIRIRPSAPFAVPGFIAYATDLLARAECNVLVVSTYSYDYVLVKSQQINRATAALEAGGFPAYSNGALH